tara:strand:- start:487 stop:699 length:213 start_codon:yes stop_codon:yes gene_type:complete
MLVDKRKENLILAIFDRDKQSEDEQGIIRDYVRVSDMVMDHIDKFSHFGESRIKPESFNFKGVTEWSFAR